MITQKFISTLLQSRDAMHLAHWSTTSYSQHQTLGEYYDGILGLTDEFTENYFGQSRRIPIEVMAIDPLKPENPVEHLNKLKKTITQERSKYSSDLQNIMDEMLGLINKTLYKLTLV